MKTAVAASSESSEMEQTGIFSAPPLEQLIEDLQRENAKLRRTVHELEGYRNLAYRDSLTGLWNRRYFDERLSQELSLARRRASRRLSVMVLDLNDLKRINDEDGHAAGDQALKRAGAFLRSRLREEDVVCRVGGDEFAVILLELGPPECTQLRLRLRSELAAQSARRVAPVSLSIGTASYPDEASSARELFLRADEQMYLDKRLSKGLFGQL